MRFEPGSMQETILKRAPRAAEEAITTLEHELETYQYTRRAPNLNDSRPAPRSMCSCLAPIFAWF